MLVSLSLAVLKKEGKEGLRGQSVLPWAGVAVSLFLLVSTSNLDKLTGTVVILLGIPIFLYYSKKTDVREIEVQLVSEETVLAHNLLKRNRFLANLVRLTRNAYIRLRRRQS